MSDFWIAGSVAALLLLLAVAGLLHKAWFPDGLDLPPGTAFRLNAWALVAVAVAFTARWALRQPGWSDLLRFAVALAPILPSALYVRAIFRWVRTLDELQRRIQTGALAFAAVVLGFAMLGVDLLQGAGFLRQLHWGLEFAFAVVFLLWMIGCGLFTRRYA